MTETKFTPGPWKYKKGRKSHHEWSNLFTAKRGRTFLFGCEGLSESDSHLIAAAPDLYAALSLFMEYNELMDEGDDVAGMLKYAELMEAAPKALSKARGES